MADETRAANANDLLAVYQDLAARYGEQGWWPADDRFEIMIGAILTQNTAWTNVEKAIVNLKVARLCDAESLAQIDQDRLAQLVRPSGYFNQKARRIRGFADWYLHRGGFRGLSALDTAELRQQLLSVHGIGEETADDMLLYAFERPSFVIDTYTHRLMQRLGLASGDESYAQLQALFHDHLAPNVERFKQYHALIVSHAKRHCRKRPDCIACPLQARCRHGGE